MRLLLPLVAVLAIYGLVASLSGLSGSGIVFGVAVPYVAASLFVVGFIWRVLKWAGAPVPFRTPTTCGQEKSLPWIKQDKLDNPHNLAGVVLRMALEVLVFRSLMRNTRSELGEGPKLVYAESKWLWAAALAFHWSFLIVVLRHMRFFSEPVPFFVLGIQSLDGLLQIGIPVLYLTDMALVGAVTYLFLRRVLIPQMRYISLPADYFPLFLILGIAATGILMRYFLKVDVIAVKQLALGLATFQPPDPSGIGSIFFAHLTFVSVLIAYIPFSKISHMGGVFMSPSRNLANNNRMMRHVNPWNYPVKVHTYEEYEDEFRDVMKGAGLPLEKES